MLYPQAVSKKHYLRNMIKLGIAVSLCGPTSLLAQQTQPAAEAEVE